MNPTEWHNSTIAAKTVENLKKHAFNAEYFEDRATAIEHILSLVEPTASVGTGRSMTLVGLNMHDTLRARGNTVYDHATAANSEESMRICRQQLDADVFMCSANAISMDGAIVNIDGRSNRVAAMSFGPRKIIIVAGINKIAADLPAAMFRARNTAAPMNAKRLNKKTPCAVTGMCSDCNSPDRICRTFTELRRCPSGAEYHVIIIGESLGF